MISLNEFLVFLLKKAELKKKVKKRNSQNKAPSHKDVVINEQSGSNLQMFEQYRKVKTKTKKS